MSEPDDRGPAADLTSRLEGVEQAVADVEARLSALTSLVESLRATAPQTVRATPLAPAAAAPPIRAAEAATVAGAVPPPGAVPKTTAAGPAPGAPASGPRRASSTPDPTSAELESVIAGRWLNRVGIIAVGLGVTYFLKYAIDNDWIGPAGQVAIGLVLGAAILASVPWFTRRGYTYFGDGMTGLGAAVLYASVWAGGNYYHLYSTAMAFGAMVVVTAALVAIALGRNAEAAAVIALVGGFLSPILVSTGQNEEVPLFTYLGVLDAALLPIAYARRWSAIEWPAFALTQLYFWLWFGQRYTDPAFLPTAAFAAIFFAIFLVLPALRAQTDGRILASQALLVALNAGACLLAFTAMLFSDSRWELTGIALALAAVHLVMARVVPTRGGQAQARLVFGGLALTLATLVIPIRLEGRWITMACAIEGAVLVWTGFRARVTGVRLLGLVLLYLAGFQVLAAPAVVERVLFNGHFGTECVTVASIAIAVWAAMRAPAAATEWERLLFGILGVGVNVLALWALTFEMHTYFELSTVATGEAYNGLAEGLAISLLWTVYAAALLSLGVRQQQPGLRWQALALFGITTVKVFFSDTASLDGFYRIGSAVALGVVLLVVSFVYQRRMAAAAPAPADQP